MSSTKIKDIATHKKDAETGKTMDEIIDLWTKMIEADAVHDDKIVSNVEQMQRKADEAVEILREKLARLHVIALSAVASAGGIAASEADLMANLSKERLARADLQAQLDRLKAEHDKCPDLIAALRRQIKETKDALELDDSKLEATKVQVQAETLALEQELQTRVKLATAAPTAAKQKGGRVKLGAGAPPQGGKAPLLPAPSGGKLGDAGLKFGAMDADGDGVLSKEEFKSKLGAMGWSLAELEETFTAMDRNQDGGISADEFAAFCQMEDKKLEAGTLSGIAKLRQELAAAIKVHAPCDDLIASLRKQLAVMEAQLADLKAQLAATPAAPAAAAPAPAKICGVGMLLQSHEGYDSLWVTKLLPGLPAHNSGQIQLHDNLIRVDQTGVSGWDLIDVCNLIKGIKRRVPSRVCLSISIRLPLHTYTSFYTATTYHFQRDSTCSVQVSRIPIP